MFRATILTLKSKLRFDFLLVLVLLLLILINFIGALGPEIGFDALWYHLTIPKLYIQEGRVFFIPGNLLYYSAMPKLIEMFYIVAIYIGSEVAAKVVHFLFGIATLVVLYKLSRFFLSRTGSLLVLVVFYSNLVVSWQSITAYIDLGRTFFEVLGLYFLISYFKKKDDSNLTRSSISIGLAISSKLLAIGSLPIFVIILFLNKIKSSEIAKFVAIALSIPLPWFVFAYLNTGNPIYPFFSELYEIHPSVNISNILSFVRSADPISPIYLIMLPLILGASRKFDKLTKIVGIYSILSLLIWFMTPQTGGGRFLMPYLPALSLLVVMTLFSFKEKALRYFIIIVILFIASITVMYRGIANTKYLPVLIGKESRHDFLSHNLNFGFGDFYDTDYYFKKNIKTSDKVLIYGTHNLFYVNFPFIHESWVKKGDKFNYVLVQNAELPKAFSEWDIIYENQSTHVKLYTKGRTMWEY